MLAAFVLMTSVSISFSQNLVPNPSFEQYTECPDNWSEEGDILPCLPWFLPTLGTADYFHMCATAIVDVPDNFEGSQLPVHGQAYGGMYTRWGDMDFHYREYLSVELTTPLTAGSGYLVSFYVSMSEGDCPVKQFGALFTQEPPVPNGHENLLYDPQIEVNGEYLDDDDEWMYIERCFVAQGGEAFITLGNFRDNFETTGPGCDDPAYYYLDSVTVTEEPVSFDDFVMDPAEACDSFEIYPGQSDNYLWEDGSTSSTFIATQSGNYSVTLSEQCHFNIGEIDVTIIHSAPPVMLPNDTVLCIGETLEISLDPESGTYEWQDGSNDPTYYITVDGQYSVTLDDSCYITSDAFNVSFIEPVEQFSLGADTSICFGDEFTISLDPLLGTFTWQDGSDEAFFTIDDEGTYTLTISNLCGQVEDEITVDVIPEIDFTIGPDIVLCDGESFTVELDPDLGTFEWHDGSTESSYTIFDEDMVSVTVSNGCFSESDEMAIDIVYEPVFTLGSDITVCESQFPIVFDLSNTPFAESFIWQDGSTSNDYEVTAPGYYTVTVSNSCFEVFDDIYVFLDDGDPVVQLPPDQLICIGQTVTLDAGGLMGTYMWQDMSTADTLLVTQAGTYSLTVTNICGSGSDSVNINYVEALSPPDLGADFSLCPGETGVLYANVDAVSYQWSTSTDTLSTADSLVINTAGTYFLQISDACSSASDTIVISSNENPPDVDLPEPVDLCFGDSVIVDAGITGVQYQWEGGAILSSLTIHVPGTYSLTVSNACGSDVDSIIINDAGFPPYVDLGDDFTLCEGDSFILYPPMAFVDTWLWHDGSTSSMFHVQNSGTIFVQVSNQCGISSDTLRVTMLAATPPLDLGPDLSICPGETVTLTISEPNVDVVWNDSSTASDLIVSEEGIVYATISNACGSSTDTILVNLLPDVPLLDLGSDQSLCPGETIVFDPVISEVDYLWHDGSSASSYQTMSPGTVILTISNACGSSSDTVVIVEDTNGPQLDLGPDILACEGDTVILDAGISGVEYLWQDGSVASQYFATISGVYFLQVTNACGSDADTILVDINGTIPTPSLGPDAILCDDEVLLLISNADDETDIEWSDGSNGSSLMVSGAGTYILYESNHCGSASDSIVVSYESEPLPFDLGEDVVLCLGESIVLNAPNTTDLITWADGSHTSTFLADAEQTYSLVISNDCGVVSDEVDVSFDTHEPIVDLGPSQALCPGQSVTLEATQSFTADYLWSTGSTMPTLQVSQPDVYAVTVSTQCYTVSDDVIITADQECGNELFIPNIFSPNGDNINDQWSVNFSDPLITGIKCRIFDRWGDLVFANSDIPIVWNGKQNNQELNPGVFVFMITLEKQDGTRDVLSGDITLVR